ncbi:unnamed protein product [Sordaria macrospora k-hell]|uniref:WGS project CABT00000000 data, contig 2.15 n=1 Tax=Sordaria macrospora (strain ATCC MYA-333 / DSM 997 / K(L3346) / K-hell) TaxID=771870 RepID=F7VZC3_SORMK|nr:uncharacterized protein SMAC_04101 [Sordaria macrospora k-hell]CCC10871.1 unnamed protein product [Sordaria macrospora k-hell]
MALEVTAKGMGSSSGGDEECGCYMEAIEIRRGESPTAEAKQCLQSCRDQFLETVSIEHETSEGWKYICKDLTSKTPSSRFWSLYWCDTTFCGVWINQTGGLQQDPISVCSVTGFIVMVALAFLCLQRHKKHRSGLDDVRGRSRSRLDNGIAPRGSPTPLIASSHDSRPLIPPLRLRDRKLLPSILRSGHNQSPSPPLTPLTPAHSHGGGGGGGHSSVMFPSSPITSPTTNKLVPRYERTPRVHGTTGSLPSLPPPALFGIHGSGAPRSRGSLSSYGAGSTTGPSSLRNEAFSFSGTTSPPPTSPTRPPRPHEGPLEIPDLVKPAPFPFGSRMNRSVPSASPQPVSPLSHTSSLAMGGSSASPMWNPARAVSSPRDERASGDHHVVGEYSGQDRGSWGSWSDNGYGDSYGNGNGNGSGRKVASAIVGNSGHATGALSPVRGARSISTCAVSPPPRLPLRPMAISTMSSAVSSSGPIGFAVTGGPGRTSNSAAVSTLHEEDGGLF